MAAEPSDWFASPQFATQLEARVVDDSGSEPRIHGFGVRSDLAKHFAVADVMFLALTGEEPLPRQSESLRRALVLLAPIGAGSAPSHLGILAHMVARDYAASLASSAAALAERAATVVADRTLLLAALREDRLPRELPLAPEEEEAALEIATLFADCSEVAKRPWFVRLDATSAAIAVLFECGLTDNWQLESMLFWAWAPCVMAEMGTRARDPMDAYPINLPRFRYVER